MNKRQVTARRAGGCTSEISQVVRYKLCIHDLARLLAWYIRALVAWSGGEKKKRFGKDSFVSRGGGVKKKGEKGMETAGAHF